MAYIGNIPAESYASFETETFSVSATANYTLSHAVTNENEIRLVINGVVQQPGSGKAYTASGTTLTLTSATVSGDSMYAVYLGRALQTVNPPNASVGTAQLGSDAVTGAKIADDAISDEHLDPTAITGQTAETSIATDDLILLSDTSASGALKKMTRANFVSGVGGDNAPFFFAKKGAQQQPSDNVLTKVQYDTEVYDPSGVYDNSTNYRFTPNVSGYYYIFAGVGVTAFGVSLMASAELEIRLNGSQITRCANNGSNNYQYWFTPTAQTIVQMNGTSDYIEIYARGDVTSSTPIYFYQSGYTWFGGYKIID